MEYITIREACEICHASEKKLRDAITAGEIPFTMQMDDSGRWGSWRPVKHLAVSDLEKWLENNPPTKRRERVWKRA